MGFEAWAPLVRAMRFDHPVVTRIAEAVGALLRVPHHISYNRFIVALQTTSTDPSSVFSPNGQPLVSMLFF